VKISGLSILTRKVLVTRSFGAEAWRVFFRDVALEHSTFRRPITSTTFVALPDYLSFHDELARRFYPGGEEALCELGAKAARFALLEGPLKDFIKDPGISALADAFPKLWQRYFAETPSWSEATLTQHGIEFRVRELPLWHPYFEHVVVGYMKELLDLHCASPVATQRLTRDRGRDYDYLFVTDPVYAAETEDSAPSSDQRARRAASQRVLTERELEVLRLVGHGKTNREIGFLLGISHKTVQHHVAHAYDKAGIYSRAGAALWLAERGLAV
jgi:DNA-binding CsgD family transcriptional regulator